MSEHSDYLADAIAEDESRPLVGEPCTRQQLIEAVVAAAGQVCQTAAFGKSGHPSRHGGAPVSREENAE